MVLHTTWLILSERIMMKKEVKYDLPKRENSIKERSTNLIRLKCFSFGVEYDCCAKNITYLV